MQQVVVNGLLTTYELAGSGRAVLLLHGWGDSLITYDSMAEQLEKKYRVARLDLPGFGKSQTPLDAWGLEDYASFVDAFLKKLGIDEVHAIVGHSNGGALAIKGLAKGILDSDKLVLIASAGIRDKRKTRRLLIKFVAKTGKILTFWLPTATRQRLRKKLYGTVGSDMFVAPHLQETFKRTVRQDVQADASRLALPTLLIYGDKDEATPPSYGHIYHQLIKDSRLEILEDATHFVHHDQAEKVNDLVKEFLE